MNQEQQQALKRLQRLEAVRREHVLTYSESQEYRLLAATVAPMMLELWEVVNELPNAVIHKEAKELRKQVRQLTRSLRGARMRIADLEYRSRFLTPVQHAHPILAEDGVTSPQDRQFEDSSNM